MRVSLVSCVFSGFFMIFTRMFSHVFYHGFFICYRLFLNLSNFCAIHSRWWWQISNAVARESLERQCNLCRLGRESVDSQSESLTKKKEHVQHMSKIRHYYMSVWLYKNSLWWFGRFGLVIPCHLLSVIVTWLKKCCVRGLCRETPWHEALRGQDQGRTDWNGT